MCGAIRAVSRHTKRPRHREDRRLILHPGIDKSSSAELSEAINSMWTYYRKAAICYAYIGDVSPERDDMEDDPLSWSEERALVLWSGQQQVVLAQLCQSQWFHRGWTLQELIAPRDLVFFDVAWNRIGSRDDSWMSQLIRCVTGIPEDILTAGFYLEAKLQSTSVAKRMSWAVSRRCRRPEDEAYCLLGIFGINMPMLYGEGRKAFRRLQEEILKYSTDHSIFAHQNISNSPHKPLLAAEPFDFRNCENIDACNPDEQMESYSMTNRGLMITLPVPEEWDTRDMDQKPKILVALNCQKGSLAVTLKLERLSRSRALPKLPMEYRVFTAFI